MMCPMHVQVVLDVALMTLAIPLQRAFVGGAQREGSVADSVDLPSPGIA